MDKEELPELGDVTDLSFSDDDALCSRAQKKGQGIILLISINLVPRVTAIGHIH